MKDHNNMNFWEHLETLRWHLLRSIVAVLVGAVVAFVAKVVAFVAKDFIFDVLLLAPISPKFLTNDYACFGNQPNAFVFAKYPTIRAVGGASYGVFGSRIYNRFSLCFLSNLEFCSSCFAFPRKKIHELGNIYGVLAIYFLGNYSVSSEVKNVINIRSYIGAVTSIVLSSGIVFELPIVIYFLVKVGIVNADFLRKYRRHALVLIMIVSAILTPPDPFSLY